MRQRDDDEGLDYRPRIGGGGKEAIWFAEGESNASKVETWEATTWFARFARSKSIFWVGLSYSSSVPPHRAPWLMSSSRRKRYDRQIEPFKFPGGGNPWAELILIPGN